MSLDGGGRLDAQPPQALASLHLQAQRRDHADELARSFVDEASFQLSSGGVEVQFQDLTLDVNLPNDKFCDKICCKKGPKKRILKGISDSIPAGCMVALMGASGAGKTTLLNILARRNKQNGGKVLYNGKEPSDDDVASTAAYIQQEDIFFGSLTVSEHLAIQARLRLPKKMDKKERDRRVDTVLTKMGLKKCAGAKIGNAAAGEGRGISGGEKKRLNIATELITAPSIIFADEPTTGLDSFIAYTAVSVLRELADRGHTVICTIHQPNSRIFEMFDWLLLLGEGQILYSGDRLGGVEWFRRLRFPCPVTQNPADFLVKLVAVTDENREEKLVVLEKWATLWKEQSAEFLDEWNGGLREEFVRKFADYDQQRIDLIVRKTSKNPDQLPSTRSSFVSKTSRAFASRSGRNMSLGGFEIGAIDAKPKAGRQHSLAAISADEDRIGWFSQLSILLKRSAISNSRDPVLLIARAMQTVVLGLVIGFLFFQLGWNAADSQTKVATMFTILMNQSMTSAMGVAQVFPEEKPIIRREYDTGLINVCSYLLAKMIAELPMQIFFPILFGTMTYWLADLNSEFVRYLISLLIVILNANTALSIGYFASAISGSADTALAVSQIILLPLILMGGFLVQLDEISPFWIWIEYLSPFRYGLSAFSMTVFYDVDLDFGGQKLTGQEFLESRLGIDTSKSFYIWCFISLFIMTVGWRILTSVALQLVFRYTKKEGG